ncbi:MAG: prepilin-type N-terminal cleavage/methylation domain-containing protein [Syntrophobacterales bacterium]|nr:prepilin-type N-terminal cleavage/methylation domain-containing protein [Syntrophobacterales bacterium]
MLSLAIKLKSSRAFTLMEVLIAITIGTMVMGILATALSLSLRAWERAKKPPDTTLYDLLELLSTQVVFLNRSPIAYRGETRPFFIGGKTDLYFATNFSPIGRSMNCPVLVHYHFDEANRTLSYTQMIIPGTLPEGSTIVEDFLNRREEALITISSVSRVSFGYVEQENSSPVSTWENPMALPIKIIVEIQSLDKKDIIVRSSYVNLFNIPYEISLPQGKTDVSSKKQ